jgi:hypothetical protein
LKAPKEVAQSKVTPNRARGPSGAYHGSCWAEGPLPRSLPRLSKEGERRAGGLRTDAPKPVEWESFASDEAPGPTADRFLQTMLNRGLSPFQPFVERREIPLGETPRHPEPPWITGITVPLYATCCLELYNHIVDQAAYLTCANESCDRLFRRQTGRAQHGQHRSRCLRYCSRECARTQAQRALRARRRAQKPQPDQQKK